jgi:very-short-patch-repair endonuclease
MFRMASEQNVDSHAITRDRARRLREQMDLPERLLWKRLNRGQIRGCYFRRQHPAGNYILDFYCDAVRLAIEVDGASHDAAGRAAHDRRRDAWLAKGEITVLRIAARDVLKAMEDVVATVDARIEDLLQRQLSR